MFVNEEGGLAQLARALALQAKGHRFDSDILHLFRGVVHRYDVFKLVEKSEIIKTVILTLLAGKREEKEGERECEGRDDKETKANKGAWWMPWLSEAKKDVVSCEKLRIGANGR